MKKTAIFYSFNSVNTATIAEKIKTAYPDPIDSVNAENVTEEIFLSYDNLILGIPTWWDGELPNYWDEFVPAIEDMDLTNKKIALFGLGNQVKYPDNFGDAIGIMASLLESRGAKIVGYTDTKDYTFTKSRAVREDQFVGLMIDVENQSERTEKRIKKWITQLKRVLK